MLRLALRLTPSPAHYLLGAAYVVTQLVYQGLGARTSLFDEG